MSSDTSNTYSYPYIYNYGVGSQVAYYEYEYEPEATDSDTSPDDSTEAEYNPIYGDETAEELLGTAEDDGIIGLGGDDDLYGEEGDDLLLGIDATNFGAGEIDYLTGGTGADIFFLGTTDQAFYVENGADDFAIISDYNSVEEDTIVAHGKARDYELVALDDDLGIAISYQGELIGAVLDNSDLSLSTDFYFMDETSDL